MRATTLQPANKNAERRYFIGGSDARVIVGDDEAALVRLWQEKRGEVEPMDLSGNLVVQLAVVTEGLNRRWFEANTGRGISDVQKRVRHPTLRWIQLANRQAHRFLARLVGLERRVMSSLSEEHFAALQFGRDWHTRDLAQVRAPEAIGPIADTARESFLARKI